MSDAHTEDLQNYRARKASVSDRYSGVQRDLTAFAEGLKMSDSSVQRAISILKRYKHKNNCAGINSSALAAACLYIACRQENVPRSYKEIAGTARVSVKDIGRLAKKIVAALNIVEEREGLPTVKPDDFLRRFCSFLDLPMAVEKRARYIANRNAELGILTGRSPVSIAGAVIYMAANSLQVDCKFKSVSESIGISELTIREALKVLEEHPEKVLPAGVSYCNDTRKRTLRNPSKQQ